ncbi:MAG TPA: hypothetical protein VKU00_20335 [Chthonomonadaceae bacterium]|nr:hypothetical protein [Chthonomonadaceae bacterium]
MSDKQNSSGSFHSEAQEEIELTGEAQTALREQLATLPSPAPQPGFNHQLLAALSSGRDFAPWRTQALVRLRWMLLPCALGFCITWPLLHWGLFTKLPSPAPVPGPMSVNAAPALLPLPTEVIPTTPKNLPPGWLPKVQDKQPKQGPGTGIMGGMSMLGAPRANPIKASTSTHQGRQ